MLSKHFKNIFLSLIVLLAPALASCVDDLLMDDGPVGPGQANVQMTVSYYPNVTNDLGSSRAAGNAIETIKSLQIAVFNEDGTLARLYKDSELNYTRGTHDDQPSMSDEDKINGGTWTEGSQAKATLNLGGLSYGKYRFYAIVNHTVVDGDLFSDNEMNAEQRLLNRTVTWDLTNIGNNSQMFGYFTLADGKTTDKPLAGLQAQTVTIDKANIGLHAWVKRLASKVTVGFDGSELHQNVNIYIHKVTIKDIPISCPLGVDNQPKSTLQDRSDVLHLDGETIYFDNNGVANSDPGSGENDYKKWLMVSNGLEGLVGSDHSATAPALFFYENLQGDYSDKTKYPNREAYNKEPKAGWVHEYLNRPEEHYNKRPWDYDTKDNIATGTYIEVEGFYQSRNDLNTTSGPIKYRFMLGKNTTYNYNAQRNHHYKLTLKFKGWANQPEWHIEYVEDKPALYVPEPFYMPYLYNQRVEMPVRWIGNLTNLEIKVTENDWGPYEKSTGRMATSYDSKADPNAFAWNVNSWNLFNGLTGSYQHLGFLALAMEKDAKPEIISNTSFAGQKKAFNSLQHDYENIVTDRTNINGITINRACQNNRTLSTTDLTVGEHGSKDNIDLSTYYRVSQEGQSKTLMLPLFTRYKSMINASGFSGNNPYEYYHRKGKLEFKATFKLSNGKDTIINAFTNIYQVPRLVNPKGVWRKSGSTSPFDVVIMDRKGPEANADFVPLVSDGSWSAEVEVDPAGNFSLSPGNTSYFDKENPGKIIGKSDSQIKFRINFGGASSACGIIAVRYNGDKCIHHIFVRSGDEPLDITGNGKAEWLAYNLHHGGDGTPDTSTSGNAELTKSPLAFGSYFKRKNLNQGILEKNNERGTWAGAPSSLYHFGQNGYINPAKNEPKLELSNNGTAEWYVIKSKRLTHALTYTENSKTGVRTFPVVNNVKNIQKTQYNDKEVWQTITLTDGTLCELPTFEQFKDLSDYSNFGYGIMYGDESTKTASKFFDATQYDSSKPNTERGMRGIVVYNKDNANQIFFPLSRSGHGRRSQAFNNYNNRYKNGKLLYGDTDKLLEINPNDSTNNNAYRPIPYNLPNNPGAIYWIKIIDNYGHVEGTASGTPDYYPCAAWDMNYFNFDFGPYTANCLYQGKPRYTSKKGVYYDGYPESNYSTGSDAMPIRLVLKK